MPSEWAMEKTNKIVEHWDISDSMEPLIAEALDAARAQGRRDGLEEAAKIADSHDTRYGCVDAIAAKIRSRMQEPKA